MKTLESVGALGGGYRHSGPFPPAVSRRHFDEKVEAGWLQVRARHRFIVFVMWAMH